MSENPVPHVRFEFDPDFDGGDFSGTGSFAYVPLTEVEELGAEEAFSRKTGLPEASMIHHTLDELYDAEGTRLPDDADVPVVPGR